ncbi:hypothetical protein [Pseudoxanthomonas indica]|uniref:Uncharacterized protein n=1 Tax=Pseudoxanthomonas indica TaxID=428993 RepID=A0A1T5JB47_9GAMM|nr:hypothetical protein [Pseudoxanthomonas indica]GGD57716.1 hypothetical protein GCM10007235_32470 [Pseudoxanthomonas indica]SKC48670.1 hypothetical protein SAMN06296058_0672 [Pseudoxanthomonas indica]
MASSPNRPDGQKLEHVKSLEARVEALEFIVLGLLRGSRDNPTCKRSVIATFELLDKVLEAPEMRQKKAYRDACRMAFSEAIMLAWGGIEPDLDSQSRKH